eukprot:gnl/Spiro4/12315_TR6495_c0_g1_i1.p1 gnl/Spiro4/12315_TR6495_c0_g1~~gnl/Spiro4/12315_TR6495_c0_g1_i1.p1  ORF type:complete len:1132 (-),score=366.02 gnl/Spiro4/12315_TR6495_c0_g1_i1:60-3389(-)
MSAKAVREFDGLNILRAGLDHVTKGAIRFSDRLVSVKTGYDKQALIDRNPWLRTTPLVVKPDQLIKRRGVNGLIKLNCDADAAFAWIAERMGTTIVHEGVSGVLDTFIISEFVPHSQSDEVYLCIRCLRNGDEILFHHEGGVEVGDVDAKASKLLVPVSASVTPAEVSAQLLAHIPETKRERLAAFIAAVHQVVIEQHFTYLEINPLVMLHDAHSHLTSFVPLDLAAKIDQTASFICLNSWGNTLVFPPPFGRQLTPDEAYIQELDSKTGASLKLTILNPNGRVWLMVAGGGASVVYTDTVADLGFAHELANYGEYSGAPTKGMTYEYARTLLDAMTRGPVNPLGKVLIIGGGIANFTNVAETFEGIIDAIKQLAERLVHHAVKIFVRRGGPNSAEGLRNIKDAVSALGIPIQVFGAETFMTAVVPLALGLPCELADKCSGAPSFASEASINQYAASVAASINLRRESTVLPEGARGADDRARLFSQSTRAIVYGMQPNAVQTMLDFDNLCKREKPSVAAIVYPFAGAHYRKFFWGTSEVLLPVVPTIKEAVERDSSISTMVNFASYRSVLDSTREALAFPSIRSICIIAEGVPERQARLLLEESKAKGVVIIGPATVGGIKPGSFRIGNTGGALDNIISSKLYRPGCVAYVSRSGGMSNELNNLISRHSSGVFEGIAIGGDRYPGTNFLDHLLRFQAQDGVKMLVLLGEVGGVEEYDVCEALKSGVITKPLVAWCVGTCASMLGSEVQFGHAGALANSTLETAAAKNEALRAAGAHVPTSFNDLGVVIRTVYNQLLAQRIVTEVVEMAPPEVPKDFDWAVKLGLVRKSAQFVSTISDDRGEELLYAGMPISRVFEQQIGIGGVLSLLWFRRLLPASACKFIEMVLMMTADHGPAVCGAHNTIVTARAGKDLVSSLCSGLLTIGPRFGGAVDEAAAQFSGAIDRALSPLAFVDEMKKNNKLIMGIGHRVKSLANPDKRVTILKEYALRNFGGSNPCLNFALEVEKITTKKRDNLILNVDGCIGVCFVDLLRGCGGFSISEANECISHGFLNGLFVLGRSIGFIGHYLDQTRMKEGLYRHPTDDIAYMLPEQQANKPESVVFPMMPGPSN